MVDIHTFDTGFTGMPVTSSPSWGGGVTPHPSQFPFQHHSYPIYIQGPHKDIIQGGYTEGFIQETLYREYIHVSWAP